VQSVGFLSHEAAPFGTVEKNGGGLCHVREGEARRADALSIQGGLVGRGQPGDGRA
jgi:hypothetical protein